MPAAFFGALSPVFARVEEDYDECAQATDLGEEVCTQIAQCRVKGKVYACDWWWGPPGEERCVCTIPVGELRR